MHIRNLHNWDLTPAEAIKMQNRLAGEIIQRDDLTTVRYIAGIDVGFEKQGTITKAAVCVLSFDSLQIVDYALARRPTDFPYIPGLLSFREIPAILEALTQLRIEPDILFCDGQGRAHPRRFGIASHLGLLTNLPSIGVGKSRLCGHHECLASVKGSHVPLVHKEEVIGTVLRTRANVNPVYVSVGYKISLKTAVDYVMRCVTRYKLPEPTRLADRLTHIAPDLIQSIKPDLKNGL